MLHELGSADAPAGQLIVDGRHEAEQVRVLLLGHVRREVVGESGDVLNVVAARALATDDLLGERVQRRGAQEEGVTVGGGEKQHRETSIRRCGATARTRAAALIV